MILTLKQAVQPRQSVIDDIARDDVYSIDALESLDPGSFFEENFITSGMKTLLKSVFSRLDGSNPDASGAFLLSQSMGGGKTHNLLALGLLASHPEMRAAVMGEFYTPRPIPEIDVVTFNGREHPEFGIWGHIAERLGREGTFGHLYSPLRAPSQSDWEKLLHGNPILLLVDELPPYMDWALQVSMGQSTLANATVTAMANLLSAIDSGNLPNVTLVMTDLSGSSYELADAQLNRILGDLEKEAERTVQKLSPVRLDTVELYEILRKRLFSRVPEKEEIAELATAYHQAITSAGHILDVSTDRAADIQSALRQTYPFHPSMLDLFARFRENQGYQQTRAMLRIMRQIIRDMWASDQASERYVIGAEDVNPANPRINGELGKFNDRFDNAIAHDIVRQTGDAVAQTIDGANKHIAQDVATMILISSLSTSTNPVLGLTRNEVMTYLAAPGRDIADMDQALSQLGERAWYIHVTADGRILFRTTENVRAKISSTVLNINLDRVENEIQKSLESLFSPSLRDVYQDVHALPDLKDIQGTMDRTVLVITKPDTAASGLLQEFYDSLEYKNRILFITGREDEYKTVVERKRYSIAAAQTVKEMTNQGTRANDPQMEQARDLQSDYESKFYMALRESFMTLKSPQRNGLLSIEFDPLYAETGFNGERVVREALESRQQYTSPEAMMEDKFRERIERDLWQTDSQEMPWTQIRRGAAQDTGFPIHQPSKLDDVKHQAVTRGFWREINEGRYIQKGPFEKEKARVSVPQPIGTPNQATGEITLRVDAVNADILKFVHPDGREEIVQGGQFTTNAIKGVFVAIDSTGEHASEAPREWQNTIAIRHQIINDGSSRNIELQAVPNASIRFTIDGSSPLNTGTPYTGPFSVPNEGCTVLAIAERDGVRSDQLRLPVPPMGDNRVAIDPAAPALWTHRLEVSTTKETYELLSDLAEYRATIDNIELTAEQGDKYSVWSQEGVMLTPETVERMAALLQDIHEGWALRLRLNRTAFERGSDLKTFASGRRIDVKQDEVRQDQ